ncbi:uncharacterized protein LOC107217959 [Neodiprion lecontei]|uniref:Uncharacterized protein LOC107217959 n=1 Tax=Neodiprion lecontei TaxID=441921 RepID=A0ABM3GFP0_NEOLC|nr:uncharacterized protein LOC107217959 [Neodiprion lecontei]
MPTTNPNSWQCFSWHYQVMLFVTTAVFVAIASIYWYLTCNYNYWKARGIPFPIPRLIFGNTKEITLLKTTIGEGLQNIYKKYEGCSFVGIYELRTPVLLLRDPKLIKLVLIKDFTHFQGRGIVSNESVDPLSANLINLWGPRWRVLRTKLTPAFTAAKIRNMFDLIAESSRQYKDFLKQYADSEEDLEFRNLAAKFTTQVIGTCCFGLQTNAIQNEDSEFRKMCRKVLDPSAIIAVKRVIRMYMPGMFQWLEMGLNPPDVTAFFLDAVRDLVEYREKYGVIRPDFMHLLMQIKNEVKVNGGGDCDINCHGSNSGKVVDATRILKDPDIVIDEKVMAAQAYIFFLAGFETSSTTMSFALHELASNPKILNKLTAEIDTALNKHRGFCYEAISEMDYLDRVIQETLRKHPPVGMVPRLCNKAYKIPGTETVIEEGTKVLIPIHAIHRDPAYYPDPSLFDPDRFLDENKKSREHCTFLPFGEGPRICIGTRFAYMQTKAGLVALLSGYEVNLCSKSSIPLEYDPTANILTSKSGIWLKIRHRCKRNARSQFASVFTRVEMIGILTELLDPILLTGLFIGIIYFYFTSTFNYWESKGVPYKKPTIFLGNFGDLLLFKKSQCEGIQDMYNWFRGERFFGVFRVRMPAIFLRDPDLIKCVFVKDFATFTNRGIPVNNSQDPLNGHLFNLEGKKWKSLRSKLTPTFSSGKIKRMFYLLAECSMEFERLIRRSVDRNKTLEVRALAAKFTIDVIGSCAFGIQINALADESSPFRSMAEKLSKPSYKTALWRMLRTSVPGLFKILRVQVIDPTVTKFFKNVVSDMIKEREAQGINRHDFMDLLVELKHKGILDVEHSNGRTQPLTEEEIQAAKEIELDENVIAAQAFVFFAAGYETASATISFCLHELALNPDIQWKTRQDIINSLEEYDGNLSFECVSEMKYLDKVVLETLRKHPPAPLLSRRCEGPYRVPGTDVVLPSGTRVIIPIYALHHDPEHYPNPEEFDPERFSDETKQSRHPYTFLPFGEGPRNCIGMRFALLQTKVGIISLLKSHSVKLCEKSAVPMTYSRRSLVTASEKGIWLEFVPEESSSSNLAC